MPNKIFIGFRGVARTESLPWARAPPRLLLSFPTEGGGVYKNVVFYTSKIKPLEFCNKLKIQLYLGGGYDILRKKERIVYKRARGVNKSCD